MDSPSEDSVFKLLTDLCNHIVAKDTTVPPSKVSKLRSQAYEIILSKRIRDSTPPGTSPIMDLLHCYYVFNEGVKTVAQFKNKEELKGVIDNLLKTDPKERNVNFLKALKVLVLLSSFEKDFSEENYQNPFNYGVTDQMIPKLKLEFGLAQPFPCYPPHMFQLPFSLRKQKEPDNSRQCCSQYTVQNFGPWSYLPEELRQDIAEVKTFTSPMMLASLTSSHCTPYSNPVLDCRLSSPRDLAIPGLLPDTKKVPQVALSSSTSVEVKEMYRASDVTVNTGDEVWNLAGRFDEYIPDDIWEIAAKMPQQDCAQRGPQQDFSTAHVLTEQQFLYMITGLAFGVETVTSSVRAGMLCEINNSLVILFEWELNELKALGLYHRRIYDFAFGQRAKEGVINLATRAALVEFVIEFRAKLLDVLRQCRDADQWASFVRHKISPLTKEITYIGNLLRVRGGDNILLLNSYAIMSYLTKEIMKPLNGSYWASVANILVANCKVYFKFIERFIFESNIEDHFGDFYIESNLRCERSRTSDFWDGVFRFSKRIKVPDFLRNLSRSIMLCGKTLRLLKICKPTDPLLHLISKDYPKIRCCTSYKQLADRRKELDVYRSRCCFVTGEPVTLEHILLEKEAERQACAELAALKQAETLDMIAAERKRLIQLLVAEKKHSLRVLKAAMQEAKASKENARGRARSARELEAAAQAASDEVHSWIRDTEKKEMMEYYSKLSGEFGKSKMHTEWRFKRLELNQRRVELLISEERGVRRVRSELSSAPDVFLHSCDTPATPMLATPTPATPTTQVVSSADFLSPVTLPDCGEDYSTQMTSTPYSSDADDARKQHLFTEMLDEQGNFIPFTSKKSSDVIGQDLDEATDNELFLQTRKQALLNKQAVMAHEFGTAEPTRAVPVAPRLDHENNLAELTPTQEALRNKMKVLGDEFSAAAPEARAREPRTAAQKEALINKQKVLGAEYHLPCENVTMRVPLNVAQREAVINRNKVLMSDMEAKEDSSNNARADIPVINDPNVCVINISSPSETSCVKEVAVNVINIISDSDLDSSTVSRESPNRSGLKLKLPKPFNSNFITPKCTVAEGVATPCVEFTTPAFSDTQLNVETPCQDINLFKSPKTPETDKCFNLKLAFPHLNDGFLCLNEEVKEMMGTEDDSSLFMSPEKSSQSKSDFMDGSSDGDLISDDPFGRRQIPLGLEARDAALRYTDFTDLMEDSKKNPSKFFPLPCSQEEKTEWNGMSSLVSCLHESVHQPLVYQLEILNNSVLVHYLVNLDMYGHLCFLKDHFLLLDGGFSGGLCARLCARLAGAPSPADLLSFASLDGMLDAALGYSESRDKYSDKLRLVGAHAQPPLSIQHGSPDALQCLTLIYQVEWPLNIVLSADAMQRYLATFHFLLKMKRIAWVLVQDFEYLKSRQKIPHVFAQKLRRSPQYVTLQSNRHAMATLLKALENYITISCLLTSWREYVSELKKAATLDDLVTSHAAYIKKVQFRCLMNKRSTPVMQLINDIFTVVLKYSRVLQAGEWHTTGGPYEHENFDRLKHLFLIFKQLWTYLHKVVSQLRECNYQPELLEDLITAINFNGYIAEVKPKESDVRLPFDYVLDDYLNETKRPNN